MHQPLEEGRTLFFCVRNKFVHFPEFSKSPTFFKPETSGVEALVVLEYQTSYLDSPEKGEKLLMQYWIW